MKCFGFRIPNTEEQYIIIAEDIVAAKFRAMSINQELLQTSILALVQSISEGTLDPNDIDAAYLLDVDSCQELEEIPEEWEL